MVIPDELTGAFAAAVESTLREMAGVGAVRRDPTGLTAADVTVAMGLDGDAPRWAVLLLPAGTADALARRVLAGVADPDGGFVRDCGAELLNVVAGQAKTLLFGTPYHFTFTTPTTPPAGPGPGVALGFDSDCGPFALRLCGAADAGPGG